MSDEINTRRSTSLFANVGNKGEAGSNDAPQIATDLDVLRALCNVRTTSEQRAAIVRALDGYRFSEPEHQVLFEAIRGISRGQEFSASLLTVALNNRGFPDLDLEKYFVPEALDFEHALERALGLGNERSSPTRAS